MEPSRSTRHFEALRWGATALGFAFLALCSLRPLSAVDGIAIPDDGYICLAIARNLGTGHGATFEGLTTNGFQPLWVLLLAALFGLAPGHGPDVYVHAALLLGALCASLTFALIAGWFRDRARSGLWVVALAAFWFPNGAVVQNALNAMETALALLLVTALLTALRPLDGAPLGSMSLRRAAGLGVLTGLAVLGRIDAGLLAAGLGGLLLSRSLATRSVEEMKKLVALTAVAALVCAPWFVWSGIATGHWFPISGRAIRLLSLGRLHSPDRAHYALMIERAWSTWQRHYGDHVQWLLLALVGATLAVSSARQQWAIELRRRTGLALVMFCLALVAAYVGYFFAPWFFRRYFFPLQLALAWLFAGSTAALLAAPRRTLHTGILSAVITAAALGVNLSNRVTWRMLTRDDATLWSYRNLGLWARANIPPGTAVGGGQTGALAYYATDLRVVNLDGVVSAPAYESLRRRDMLGYARRTGVRYVLGWPSDGEFLRALSHPDDAAAMRKVLDVPRIRSWGYPWVVWELAPPNP